VFEVSLDPVADEMTDPDGVELASLVGVSIITVPMVPLIGSSVIVRVVVPS
jgi:hypothetical protein